MVFELLSLLILALLSAFSWAILSKLVRHVLAQNSELVRYVALSGDKPAVQHAVQTTQEIEARQHQPTPTPAPILQAEY